MALLFMNCTRIGLKILSTSPVLQTKSRSLELMLKPMKLPCPLQRVYATRVELVCWCVPPRYLILLPNGPKGYGKLKQEMPWQKTFPSLQQTIYKRFQESSIGITHRTRISKLASRIQQLSLETIYGTVNPKSGAVLGQHSKRLLNQTLENVELFSLKKLETLWPIISPIKSKKLLIF